QIGPRRRFGNGAAIVVVAPADKRPAVVLAGLGAVELVAAGGTEFDRPEGAGRGVERGALNVAMAVGPDLGLCVGTADERVVLRHRAVAIEADDLAEVTHQILARIELWACAGRE